MFVGTECIVMCDIGYQVEAFMNSSYSSTCAIGGDFSLSVGCEGINSVSHFAYIHLLLLVFIIYSKVDNKTVLNL